MRTRLAIAAIVAVMFSAPLAPAITSGVPTQAIDHRYDAVAGVTLTEWAGINNVFGNATLIAPDRVIMPRHLINSSYMNRSSKDGTPGAYTIRFRRNPDGTLGNATDPTTFYQVKVKTWIFPNGRKDTDDVVVGILERPVTHIAPMAMDLKTIPKKNAILKVASWGPQAAPEGRVVPKGTLMNGAMKVASADKNKIKMAAPSAAASAGVVTNDSGTPLIIETSGVLKLVGYVTTPTTGVAISQLQGSRLLAR